MSIQNKFKLFTKYKKTRSDSGFTLVELLISSAIGVLVIGAAGFGLMNLLRNNRSATAEIEQRNDINRAVDFISDEIKRADTIEVDPSDNLTGVTIPSNGNAADAVLALNIPGIPGNVSNTPIVYFLSSPPDDDIWQGPKVIYRYGPPLDANGNFTNGTWGLEPLVDGISDEDVTANCDTGWTATPSSPKGFYACVSPTADDANVSETAKLFAIGDSKYANNYQVNSQVFARAEQENLTGKDADETYTPACNFTTGGLVCPPGTSGTPPTRNFKIDNLGSALARNLNGDLWDMEIAVFSKNGDGASATESLLGTQTVNGSDSIDFEVTTNLPVVFKVKPNTDASGSSGTDFDPSIQNRDFVTSTDSGQFKLLDADQLSTELERSYQKSDGTFQKTAKEVLSDNNLIDSIQPDKINLKDNQYVIAFEVGQPGADDSHPGKDYNDQLLLITVNNAPSE